MFVPGERKVNCCTGFISFFYINWLRRDGLFNKLALTSPGFSDIEVISFRILGVISYGGFIDTIKYRVFRFYFKNGVYYYLAKRKYSAGVQK